MPDLVILAHGGSWDRRFQISSLAASAAAAGDAVEIALFFAALDRFARDRWDDLDPEPPVARAQLERLALPPLSEMLALGRSSGAIRIFACSASVRVLGLELREVQARVDAVLGWQSFAQRIRDARSVVTL